MDEDAIASAEKLSKKHWLKQNQSACLLALFVGLAGLAFDLITPLGVAAGVIYILFVLTAFRFRERYTAFLFAGIGTAFTLKGYFVIQETQAASIWVVQLNRALSVLTLWVVAFIVYSQKRSEHRTQEESNKAKTINNTVLDGLITIDSSGLIQSFNLAAEKIFGYSADEVVGKNIKMLMPEPYQSKHDIYLENYITNGDSIRSNQSRTDQSSYDQSHSDLESQEYDQTAQQIVGTVRSVEAIRKNGQRFPVDIGINKMSYSNQTLFVGTIRDITERVAAEAFQREALAKKERYDRVVEATHIVVWEYDIENDALYVDNTFSKLIGGQDVTEGLCLSQLRSLVHPDDKTAVIAAWEVYLDKPDNELDLTYRIKQSDDRWLWIRENGKVIKDASGKVTKISGIYEDVNDKKKEQHAISEFNALTVKDSLNSDEKITAVLNLGLRYFDTEIAFVSQIIDQDYLVQYSEPKGVVPDHAHFVYSNTYCYHVFGTNQVKAWHNAGDSEIATHPCYQEQKLNTYIGTTLFVNQIAFGTLAFVKQAARDKAFTTGDENLIRLMGQWISSEIAQQQSIKRIEDSERFLRLVQDTIPDLIFVKDEDYRIVRANPAFLNAYPESMRDSVIGTTTVESYDKEEAEAFLYQDRLAFEEGSSEIEETIQFPDGMERTLDTKKLRFEDNEGNRFILGIARDITTKKQAIEEMLRSNQELERFAYMASHDLQEPLRMVINFTQLLEKHYAEQLDERAGEYINFARNGASRMHQLVKDLLDYARVGNEAETHQELNLDFLPLAIQQNLSDSISQTEAKIDWPVMPRVTGDPIRVCSIFQNIIGNAIKYRSAGKTPEIKVSVAPHEEAYLFTIQDNGIGMKQQYCEKIFEPFKRLHRKEEYSGTGMGLSICRKSIEGLGGKIWAESELGIGTKFFFTLPKADTLTLQ